MVKHLWVSLLTVTLFCGCVAGVFEVEIPFSDSQIVANGFVGPEGTRIHLARSLNPNDTAFLGAIPPIGGAEITLYFTDGQTELLSETSPGMYTSPVGIPSGTEVDIEIVPTPEDNASKISIPNVVVPEDVQDISFTFGSVDTSGGISAKSYNFFSTLEINKVSLDQQPYVVVYADTDQGVVPSSLSYSPLLAQDVFSACGFVSDAWLVFPTYCYGSVEDITLQIEFNAWFEYDADTRKINNGLPIDINVTVAVVQPVIYDQIKSLNYSKDQFDQIFSTPNVYTSNIQGGLGVIGGAIFREFTVRLE